MVIVVPMGPLFCEMPVTVSGELTVNCTPLLGNPNSVRVTGPFVVLAGTVTVTLVSLHELTFATKLLNLTWLLPWLEPKPVPFKVMEPPI